MEVISSAKQPNNNSVHIAFDTELNLRVQLP